MSIELEELCSNIRKSGRSLKHEPFQLVFVIGKWWIKKSEVVHSYISPATDSAAFWTYKDILEIKLYIIVNSRHSIYFTQ